MNPIVNLDAVTLGPVGNGGRFNAEFASLGAQIGAKKLGVSLCVVPPGSRAFPRHAHHVNEEMLFILEGEGTWHAGSESASVRAGDLIAAPPGDGSTAHQLENTSGKVLKYLTFSTRLEPEVVEYPDSGKFGLATYAGHDKAHIRFLGRVGSSLDYFDGEA